jgi:hypothetical protein
VEGVADRSRPRTERTILHDMGHEAGDSALLDGALDLAERSAAAAGRGGSTSETSGIRAPCAWLLAATAKPAEDRSSLLTRTARGFDGDAFAGRPRHRWLAFTLVAFGRVAA